MTDNEVVRGVIMLLCFIYGQFCISLIMLFVKVLHPNGILILH